MNFVMKKTLVFVTNNAHKLKEIREILGNQFELLSLSDLNIEEEIPETADTLAGNALQKARYILNRTHYDCFADDTGLEVEALQGAPGVYSARYAGENASFDDNMNKLIQALEGQTNRKACFKTVIALVLNGEEQLFEGRVPGQILGEKRGKEGFGYDPIFQPEGFDLTFAEMDAALKNSISHRGRAVRKLVDFLQNQAD